MFAAFKLLPFGAKLGIGIGIIFLFLSVIGSTYFIAYNKGLNVSKVAISQYETKVQKLNADLAEKQTVSDTKIVTKYVEKIAYIDKVVYKNRDIIINNVPEQFTFSKGWIYSYNQAIQGLDIDATKAADASPSNVTDMKALAGTIIPNTGVCLAYSTQLESLQSVLRAREAINEKINN